MPHIVPKEKVTKQIIGGFEIQNIELNLFKSAQITSRILDENGNMIDISFITMVDEDYKKWGEDDNYILDFVASKLGYIIEPQVVLTDVVEVTEAPVEVTEAPVEVTEAPVEAPVEVPGTL